MHRPARAEVCSGSFAPIPRCPSYVRLCFKSGDKADIAGAQLSTPISPNGRYGISSPLKLPHWGLDARDLYNPVPLRRLGGDVGFERGRSGLPRASLAAWPFRDQASRVIVTGKDIEKFESRREAKDRSLAEAAATHLESALLNAISVHPSAE